METNSAGGGDSSKLQRQNPLTCHTTERTNYQPVTGNLLQDHGQNTAAFKAFSPEKHIHLHIYHHLTATNQLEKTHLRMH